jgi:GNAT superfamily N-acetyltransferase
MPRIPTRARPVVDEIHLRPGRLRDLRHLATIERETAAVFPPGLLPPHAARPLPRARLAQSVAASLLWVADHREAGPVGFVMCERHACCLHIAEMDVRPCHGRRGIGTRLLLHACAAASELGCRAATLTTFLHLPWNAPFYAKHGFVVISPAAAPAHLADALRGEVERGLANRVAMCRRL